MKTVSRKIVTFGRCRTEREEHISPSSAKPGLADMRIKIGKTVRPGGKQARQFRAAISIDLFG